MALRNRWRPGRKVCVSSAVYERLVWAYYPNSLWFREKIRPDVSCNPPGEDLEGAARPTIIRLLKERLGCG